MGLQKSSRCYNNNSNNTLCVKYLTKSYRVFKKDLIIADVISHTRTLLYYFLLFYKYNQLLSLKLYYIFQTSINFPLHNLVLQLMFFFSLCSKCGGNYKVSLQLVVRYLILLLLNIMMTLEVHSLVLNVIIFFRNRGGNETKTTLQIIN